MSSHLPRYVQSKPSIVEHKARDENVVQWTPKIQADLTDDADELLCYFARYPVERNHPRRPVDHPTIKRSGEVVVAHIDYTLPRVFAELITQGFLACPVVDDERKYSGFIDMLDIVHAVLYAFGVFRVELGRMEIESGSESERAADFATFFDSTKFKEAKVRDVVEKLRAGYPRAVRPGYSLLHAMEIEARGNTRRVPIVDAYNRVQSILTNSMVISLLDQNIHRLGSIRQNPVVIMMGGLRNEIFSCQSTDVVINAFKLMSDKGVTGLAVLDSRGFLVDNLSVRDLRIIGAQMKHFERLYLSVSMFKQLCREEFSNQTPANPIWVKRTDTVEDVIRSMDDGNIHRVYVCVENENKDLVPIRVITQRDVIRYLLWECGLRATSKEDLRKIMEA